MNTVNAEMVAEFRKTWESKYPNYQTRWLAYCVATADDPEKRDAADFPEWIGCK